MVWVGGIAVRWCADGDGDADRGACGARGGAGVGAGHVVIADPVGVERGPNIARRARFVAAARRLKSASTLSRPWTRARRPPCRRRITWLSLRRLWGGWPDNRPARPRATIKATSVSVVGRRLPGVGGGP